MLTCRVDVIANHVPVERSPQMSVAKKSATNVPKDIISQGQGRVNATNVKKEHMPT